MPINRNWAIDETSVEAGTRPLPFLRTEAKAASYWVQVKVIDGLPEDGVAFDISIVSRAVLPEMKVSVVFFDESRILLQQVIARPLGD